MSKGRLVNSIPDLIVEWGAKYPSLSVRCFLMERKGFSERQYRYIISCAPLNQWTGRREEFQNQIAAKTIQRHIDESVEVNAQYIAASKLALARTLKKLTTPASPLSSSDLLNAVRTIEISLNVHYKALGIPDNQGMIQIINQIKVDTAPQAQPDNRYTYEDLMEIIEMRREKKKKLQDTHASVNQPGEPKAGEFSCLPQMKYGRR